MTKILHICKNNLKENTNWNKSFGLNTWYNYDDNNSTQNNFLKFFENNPDLNGLTNISTIMKELSDQFQ